MVSGKKNRKIKIIKQYETEETLYQKRIQELAKKGFVRLATGEKVEVKIPPRFPGKPLSEYLKEIRE